MEVLSKVFSIVRLYDSLTAFEISHETGSSW